MQHYLHVPIHLHDIRHNCKIYFHICTMCNTLAHCSANTTFKVEVYGRYLWSEMSISAIIPTHKDWQNYLFQHLKVKFNILYSSYTFYNFTTIVGN
jgi:hypothetical protein